MTDDLRYAGIYAIRHIESGKVYVGQSQNIAKRIKSHRHVPSCPHLHNAIVKYGWDAFIIVIPECVADLTQLDAREQYWIETLQACDPKRGYNIRPGGKSARGFQHDEETKRKIGAGNRGKKRTPEQLAARGTRVVAPETRAKMSEARKRRGGWSQTPESRAKLSELHKGMSHTPETCAKLSANHTGVPHPHTPEQDARISAAQRARCDSEAKIARVSAYIADHREASLAEIARTLALPHTCVTRYAAWGGWRKIDGRWQNT